MFISRIMVWNNEEDEFLRESYQYNASGRERGNAWKQIADALNLVSTESIFFRVDARAVCETCALLTNCQAEKKKSELK